MAPGMNIAVRHLQELYQEQREPIDNALQAAGITVLAGIVLHASITAVYPSEWVTILLITTFVLGAREPAWGYLAATAVVLWPLWSLSPYLMALFLAVAVLARGIILDNLPWALLIIGAPLLAQGYVAALVPLAAGILAGPTVGLWTGALSALWLKLFGGMVNLSPDLLTLNEHAVDGTALASRFADANSLETLRLLVAPFASDSSVLLLHLLQIGTWAGAGYLAGRLRSSMLAERSPWGAVGAAAVAGAAVTWAGFYALPLWLDLTDVTVLTSTPWTHAGIALSATLSAALYACRHILRTPTTGRKRVKVRRGWSSVMSSDDDTSASQSQDDDLIMIELD